MSNTLVRPGIAMSFSLAWSGRPATATLKNSITWAMSTTSRSIASLLAELPVGQEQIGELDAAERRNLFVAATRVGHGGFDQAVDVELLDVERLAHVRTAVGQKLNDLGPVLHGIEAGFDGVRPGGDLAESQGRGENLDENGFHQ